MRYNKLYTDTKNSAFQHGKVTQHNVDYSLCSKWPPFVEHTRAVKHATDGLLGQ